MNLIKSMVLTFCLCFSVSLYAVEAPPVKGAAPVVEKVDAVKGKKKQQKLEKKFCCKTESGTGCYVFGDASCSNCTNFCSGDMVIEPIAK